MAEPKFTKGPWAKSGCDFILSSNGIDICDFSMSDCKVSDDEYEANMDLIAAAPDLYEAVRRMTIVLDGGASYKDMNAYLKRVLAKAIGETNG